MSRFLHDEAVTAIQQIDTCLENYAAGRKAALCVGQFVDADGRDSEHAGVYGTSAWLLLTGNLKSHAQVGRLRDECATLLRAAARGASQNAKFNSDLERMVLKIAYAFAALSGLSDSQAEASLLLERLFKSQNKGWGFAVDAAPVPMSTAITVRLILESPAARDAVSKAVAFLRSALSGVSNPYNRLFVLTTIARAEPNTVKRSEPAVAVRELYVRVAEQPTRFPNPTIIDYQDNSRTRYIRIPSDIILIEALCLLSGPWQMYLYAHTGWRIFGYLTNHTKSLQNFDVDPTGNRAAIGTYMYLQQTLQWA